MAAVAPGKGSHRDHHATVGKARDEDGNPALCVFSTATGFEAGKTYSKFRAYALLNHAGDHGGAARELAAQGYGGHPNGNGQAAAGNDPAPQMVGPVDGTQMLDAIVAFLKRFVVFGDEAQVVAVALWVVHTWAFRAALTSPRLWVNSPTPECGKNPGHGGPGPARA